MNSAEAIEWLFSLHRFGMKLGLENIRALAGALGNPHDRFASILIAGTNGKGSTAAMLHAILGAAGIRAGLYTSPHLVRTEERIRIADRDIDEQELAAILSEVRTAIETLLETKAIGASPTFFEAITAAGLVAFARAGVEIAVLEVGLGGRLDATNIVSPVLSVITSIDHDHEEQLGPTLASIGREKAGILRPGVTALLGDISAEALAAIRERAEALGAPVVLAHEGCRIESLTSTGMVQDDTPASSPRNSARFVAPPTAAQSFALTTPVCRYPRIDCPLLGDHQRDNALVAVRAAEILAASGRAIGAEAVVGGVASARWPGRLETIEGRPRLLLDGAHNPAGCRALAAHVTALGVRPVLLFAAMRDKKLEEMLETLIPLASAVVFTSPPMPRAAEPDRLLEMARKIHRSLGPPAGAATEMSPLHHPAETVLVTDVGRYVADGDVASALGRARALAGAKGLVLVAGSLFLVGAVKEVLLGLPVRAGERA